MWSHEKLMKKYSLKNIRLMRIALEGFDGWCKDWWSSGEQYADDTTLLANSQAELQDLIERVRIASENGGLFFNVKKTKIMACVNDDEPVMLTVGGQAIDVVQDFNFLGSYITNKGGSAKEIKQRLAIAGARGSTN